MFLKYVKLENIVRRKTRIDIIMSTKEEIEEFDELCLLKNEGYLLFNSDEPKKQVVDAMKDKKLGINERGYSPSQLLRGEIVKEWQKGDQDKSMEQYYKETMQKIITHFRNK